MEWKNGTIAVIIHELHLPLGSTGIIKNVLETYWSCMQNQTEYSGEKKHGGGRKAELERDYYQIQLVVDGMKNRLGHAGTHLLVNKFRMQNGQESVGLSAVCGMVKKLNPKVDKVGRRKQGSTDPESA